MYKEAIAGKIWGKVADDAQDRSRRATLERALATEGPRGYWRTILAFEREEEAAGIYTEPSIMAVAYAHLGEMDKAFDLLRQGIEARDEDSETVKVDRPLTL